MIKYIKKSRQFIIENDDICYSFYLTKEGVLQHLYFGKNTKELNIEAISNLDQDWSRTYFDTSLNRESVYEDYYYAGRSMMEIPSHGFAEKRGSQFIIEHHDGTTLTDFRYVSHHIYKGKPQLQGLPSFIDDKEVETLVITLKDAHYDVSLVTSYTIYKAHNAIIRNNTILCNEPHIKVKRAYAFSLDLPKNNYQLMHFPGDWINERNEVIEPLNHGLKRLYSNLGRSSHEQNPVAILIDENANQDHGECYGFSHVYSGNFAIDINVDKLNMTRVSMGINDEQFSWLLNEGDSFVVPEGIMIFSNKGIEGITQTFHNIIRENLINPQYVNKVRPVILNSWEGCYMDFDTQKIIDYIDAIDDMNIELFVLDDGWFGKRDNDTRSLGDWVVNEKKIDLAKVIAHTHKKGLKFGLWFEPEMINYDSDLFREHPEYALGYSSKERALSRHQFVLDTVNKEALDNVYNQITKILDKYTIDYVKWDHNRNVYDAYSHYLPANRQGETYHRLVLGSYELMDRLTKRYPNILFESCASGGGRYDLGMLYYMPQVWTSDEMDPMERLYIQYSTSRIYPLSTMGAHIGKHKTADYSVKAKLSAIGVYGLELDPRTLSEDEKKTINGVTKLYKEIRKPLINNGTLYHLSSPYASNFMALMSVSEDQEEAIVQITSIKKETIKYRFLKLKGLLKDALYENTYDKKVLSGQHYMDIGLNLSRGRNVLETDLIHLKVVKKSKE